MATNKQNILLFIGIIAMVGLVIGTFLEGGSLIQKAIFLIGAVILTSVAYANKQKMFMIIEMVVSLSSLLALWNVTAHAKYLIFIGASFLGVGYLIKIKLSKENGWWPIGALGLLLLAAGFATSAVNYPILFNSFLGFGGIIVAIYSAIELFLFKTRIASIWLILNVFFALNPMLIVFHKLFG